MEFWGVEVKAGEPLYVSPENGELIHLSQVALGDVKNVKSVNSVLVHLTVDDKKLPIGILSAERNPQIMFDLVLEKEFTLSHDWKDGSVYFCGYTCEDGDGEVPDGDDISDEEDSSESEEDSSESEDEAIIEKGKPVADVQAAIPTESKAKVTVVDPKKEESDDSERSDEDDDEFDDDDSDDDTCEDEETPKKVESSKKRPSSSEIKTPASTKKSKTETPKKQDGKKESAHTATPHPAKKSEKKTAETPKSSAQVSCKSCSKKFNSEKGLESHSKSKHGGK